MANSKKIILELVEDLPEEKMGKVISFIKFIKEEEEPILLLEPEDEIDVLNILEENQWYSSEEIKKSIEDKKDEDSRDINRRPRT
jgi:23S rRNA pseudoU1915 N3-methylase RlmH